MRAAATIVPILMAAPAYADWQNTKWGMTVAEVASAVPKTQSYTGSFVEGSNDDGSQPWIVLLKAPYEARGVSFRAEFRFDRVNRKLVGVNLRTDKFCYDILEMLTDTYGQPTRVQGDKIGAGSGEMRWIAPKQDNVVALFHYGGKCELSYSEYRGPGAKGGL